MAPVGVKPCLFTLLETTLPVVAAGNSLNCLRSPVIANKNGRLLNICLSNPVTNAYVPPDEKIEDVTWFKV